MESDDADMAPPPLATAEVSTWQLLLAASLGEGGHVAIALAHGGRVSGVPNELGGNSPLHVAATNGHAHVVRLLLEHGAEVDARNRRGVTPLVCAVEGGHTEAAQVLLQARACVLERTHDGTSLLAVAVLRGPTPLIELLLAHGASVCEQDAAGWSALHMAAYKGRANAVARIAAADTAAVLELRTCDGATALYIAAQGGHAEAVAELLRVGANVHAATRHRVEALHTAAEHGFERVCELLLQAGATIRMATKDIASPLHLAVWNRHVRVVRLLLQHGATPHDCNASGATPLHSAAYHGDERIMRLLLSAKADENAADAHNNRPLHVAARRGQAGAVRLLLQYGADPAARTSATYEDENGDTYPAAATALDLARLAGKAEVVDLLACAQARAAAPSLRHNDEVHGDTKLEAVRGDSRASKAPTALAEQTGMLRSAGDVQYADILVNRHRDGAPVVLGKGQYGVVYAGQLRGAPVAIKKLMIRAGDRQHEAVWSEVHTHMRVAHRHVVTMFGAVEKPAAREPGSVHLFIIMERAVTDVGLLLHNARDVASPRAALQDRLAGVRSRVHLLVDIAAGLAHLHAACIIHGDVKPRNVLIMPDGSAKLADFGFAVDVMRLLQRHVQPQLSHRGADASDERATSSDSNSSSSCSSRSDSLASHVTHRTTDAVQSDAAVAHGGSPLPAADLHTHPASRGASPSHNESRQLMERSNTSSTSVPHALEAAPGSGSVPAEGGCVQQALAHTQTSAELHGMRGTLLYMDPTLADGKTPITPASDMYSFGISAWEILTGSEPYAERWGPDFTSTNFLTHVAAGARPNEHLLRRLAGLPASVVALVTSCWSAAPEARPTAAQAHAVLTAALSPAH